MQIFKKIRELFEIKEEDVKVLIQEVRDLSQENIRRADEIISLKKEKEELQLEVQELKALLIEKNRDNNQEVDKWQD